MNNEKLVHEWANAYNDQDFDRFGGLYTDDTTYECRPFGLAFTGRNAFVSHLQEYAGAVPDRKFTIKRIIADRDAIAVEFDFAGTSSGVHPGLPPAGEPVTASFCSVMRLRGDRIASQTDYLVLQPQLWRSVAAAAVVAEAGSVLVAAAPV